MVRRHARQGTMGVGSVWRFAELGGHYFDERDRQAVERRAVRRFEALGYQVTLAPADPAA
jgi:hypothetical protein